MKQKKEAKESTGRKAPACDCVQPRERGIEERPYVVLGRQKTRNQKPEARTQNSR